MNKKKNPNREIVYSAFSEIKKLRRNDKLCYASVDNARDEDEKMDCKMQINCSSFLALIYDDLSMHHI
jgi:hypothetical protein